MRTLAGIACAASMMIGVAVEARAQTGNAYPVTPHQAIYPTAPIAGVTPPGAYAFKDEPVMSINNSYLGYSNFVDPTYPTPRYLSGHSAAQTPGYDPVSQPRRGTRWFGWRRRSR